MIKELSISERKLIASLRTPKHRREAGLFLMEGSKSVLDNIGMFEYEMVVARHAWLEQHADQFSTAILRKASSADMERVTALATAPDVIAVCKLPEMTFTQDVLKNRLVLALDGVQDPGNLGTIIRTCDWFGVDVILCSRNTVDVYNPKVIQSTMGALARVKVFYVDLPDVLENCDAEIFGTFMDGDNIYNMCLPKQGIIVMGNEGNGISEDVARLVGRRISIPAYHSSERRYVESLNVSIATAITLNEFRRSQ